ncbi:hypothetical protein SOVF_158090, partial [Spinacia oleracea]
MDNSSSDLSI